VETQKTDQVLKKTYTLVVRLINFQKDKPAKNVNVKIFRLEKESITLKQYAENLKNGTPFKRLMISMNTDDNGLISAELTEDIYEAKVEQYGLSKICELTQNVEVRFVEPKNHWWQQI
jgi:hypothetical protein